MNTAVQIAPWIGIAAACLALGVARATFYRVRQGAAMGCPRREAHRLAPGAVRARARGHPATAARPAGRGSEPAHRVRHAARMSDAISPRVRPSIGSCAKPSRCIRRRNELTHPPYARPELLATGPRELWSWDITQLKGPAKWVHFHLYVILDVFSRDGVGWMLAPRESAELAQELIAAPCDKEGIPPGQLTLHADRGTSMRSKPVALLLADLGVTQSHSRPHVSDDNPYSESQFRTLKYPPDFPERFASEEQARAFCQEFFAGYNQEHRHSGIGFMIPAAMHSGRAHRLYEARQVVLTQAFAKHPERFKGRLPMPPALPTQVGINLPTKTPHAQGEREPSTLNSP